MPERIEFNINGLAPSLDSYRRQWTPAPNVGLAGLWVGAAVSDASGKTYWGVRGSDDFVTGITHVVSPVCGFRTLHDSMDGNAPHLFTEYASTDWFEPVMYSEDNDRIQTAFPSGRIERDSEGFHWHDAGGRWQLHGRTISDVVLTHVPQQDNFDNEVYYRHELIYVTGTINGVDVSGYAHQDFAYGPPGMAYTELPLARHIQGMWVSWMHEYDDGQLGGGSCWQGRGDIAFGPGYHVKDGVTTVHKDVVATPGFNEAGQLITLDTAIGTDTYAFTFDTSSSPIHFFGELTANSLGIKPIRSWCWVEYAGDLINPMMLDMALAPFQLARGR